MARVLVIDDEPQLRQLVRRVLEAAGHQVTEAPDGRKGIMLFRLEKPDLVITDILMPEKEGIETIRELRAAAADVPILAISGGGRTAHLDFLDIAREFGALASLSKPFLPRQLLEEVTRLLAGTTAGDRNG